MPSTQTTDSLHMCRIGTLPYYHIRALDPTFIRAVSIVRQKCHSTPKLHTVTTLVRISAITEELLSSDGPTASNLYIYLIWGSVVRFFWVRKQSKGVMLVNMTFLTIYIVTTRWMYVGMWWNKAFCWQNIRPGSLSVVMDWHSNSSMFTSMQLVGYMKVIYPSNINILKLLRR